MKIELNGKRAIVTGSTKGIGLAIAKGLALSGADVIINGRSRESVEHASEELKKATGKAVQSFVGDLSLAQDCTKLTETFSSVDILVNNLGIFGERDFYDTGDDVWEQFFETNIMSGVRLSRNLTPSMIKKGWGRVIFISSESAFNIPSEMIHYGVTKTALLALSRGLAKRLAGTGVTVNAVLPGPTLSDGMIEQLQDDIKKNGKTLDQAARDYVMRMRPSSILQRPTTTDEVANMVVYIASQQASGTTGASIRVDGGVIDSI